MAIEQANVTTLGDYLKNHTLGETPESSDPNAMKVVDDVTAHYAGRSKDVDSENNEAAIQEALDKFTESANESKLISINSEDNENPLNAFFQTQEIDISDDLIKNGRSLINALRRDLNAYPENRQRSKAAIFNSENGKQALSQLFALISVNPDDDDDVKSLQKSARTFINEAITAKTQNLTNSYSSADPVLKASVSKILASTEGADQFKAIAKIVGQADILKITNPKAKLYKQIGKAFGGGDLGKNISDLVHSKVMTLTSTMPSVELDEALQDADLSDAYQSIRKNIAAAYEGKIQSKIESISDEDTQAAASHKLSLMMKVYKAESITESVEATKDLVKEYADQSAKLTELSSDIDGFNALSKKLKSAAKSAKPSPVVLEGEVIKALTETKGEDGADKTEAELKIEKERKDLVTELIAFSKTQIGALTSDSKAGDVENAKTYTAADISNEKTIESLRESIKGSGDESVLNLNEKLGVDINITGTDVQLILNALADPNATKVVKGSGDDAQEILSADQLVNIKGAIAEKANVAEEARYASEKAAAEAIQNITTPEELNKAIEDGVITELTIVASKGDTDSANISDRLAKVFSEKEKESKADLSKLNKIISKVEKSVFMPAAKSVPAVSLAIGSSLLNLMYSAEDGMSDDMKEALDTAAQGILDSEKSKYLAESNPALDKVIDLQRKEQVEQTVAPKLGESIVDIDSLAKTLTGKDNVTEAIPELVKKLNTVASETNIKGLGVLDNDDKDLMKPDLTGLDAGDKALKKAKQYAFILNRLEAVKSSKKAKETPAGKALIGELDKLPAKQVIRSYQSDIARIENTLEAKQEASREATKKLEELEGSNDIWEASDANEDNDVLANRASDFFKGIMKSMLRATGIKSSTFAQPISKAREESGDSADEEGTPAYTRAVYNFLDASMQATTASSDS